MGSFIGHVLPGLGFMLIGLWHLFNTIRNHVTSPWHFQTRTWFPTKYKSKLLKHVELVAIIAGSCLSISSELFIMPKKHQPLAEDWSIPPYHLKNFEHSAISLFLLIYASVALYVETRQIHIPQGMLHVIGALALSQELLMFHEHSADHMGAEGHYHWLLQIIVFVGFFSTLLEVFLPCNFLVAMVRSMSILFQGLWFIHMAFMLWVPAFIPKGCEMQHVMEVGHGAVKCGDEKANMRAKALANLQFSWYLASLLLFTILTYIRMLSCHGGSVVSYNAPFINGVSKEGYSHQGSQSSIHLMITDEDL